MSSEPSNDTSANTSSTPTASTPVVFTEDFKNTVKEYCEKDDLRMKLSKQLTATRKELSALEDKIIDFMDKQKLPVFDTGEAGLFKNSTEKKAKGLSKEILLTALSKCGQLKDPQKAEDVVKFIYDSRPIETTKVLIRK